MDKKVEGSWLVHHTNKLGTVTAPASYENTESAGKAGILLSAISADSQWNVDKKRVEALAQAANIKRLELPALLGILAGKGLIDESEGAVSVLGVTTHTALSHTSDIFRDFQPSPIELASLDLSEKASQKPIDSNFANEYLSDTYKIDSVGMKRFFEDAEIIGFVDSEDYGGEKVYFNGNVFRNENPIKVKSVLDSLSQEESDKLIAVSAELKKVACLSVHEVKIRLGDKLFNKLCAIGYFDINVVSNSEVDFGYVTLPSAFSKYSSSMVDDAFDLAKAFVSSLTYGITKSSHPRGRISMIDRLLEVLISGGEVGPVSAIGEDYKVLETKGVVKVFWGSKKGRVGYMMRLLKKEVGELALQAIRKGDVSEHSLEKLPGAALTKYKGPEANRSVVRKEQVSSDPKATNDVIQALRTGGVF